MSTRPDFLSYLSASPSVLISRRGQLLQQIAELTGELAMVRGNERQAKVEAYLSTTDLPVRDRENLANKNAMHLTISVWEIEANITTLQIEADYIKEVLDAVQR